MAILETKHSAAYNELIDASEIYRQRKHVVVISPTYNISLAELQREAGSILRTNHLGNDYASNQAFVNALHCAHFITFDRNTGVDTNYFPWMVNQQTDQHIVAEHNDNLLSPFFKPVIAFYEKLGMLPPTFHDVKTPAQLHYQTLKSLHPNAITYSEWVLENQDIVREIIDTLNRNGVLIFNRCLDQSGMVLNKSLPNNQNPSEKIVETAERLVEAVTQGTNASPEGIVINTNQLNVYLSIVIEAIKQQNQRIVGDEVWGYVFHGSGPDMIKYVDQYETIINHMHTIVVNRLPELGIPRKIYCGIIPTAELKLSLPRSNIMLLDEIGQLIKDLNIQQEISKDFRNTSDVERRNAKDRLPELKRQIRGCLQRTELAGIDFRRSFSPHATQYDALQRGPIQFPHQLTHLTFREIKDLNNQLFQLRNHTGNHV